MGKASSLNCLSNRFCHWIKEEGIWEFRETDSCTERPIRLRRKRRNALIYIESWRQKRKRENYSYRNFNNNNHNFPSLFTNVCSTAGWPFHRGIWMGRTSWATSSPLLLGEPLLLPTFLFLFLSFSCLFLSFSSLSLSFASSRSYNQVPFSSSFI